MAFDEELADRIRETLAESDVPLDERRMFGGLAFMVRGHMTVGIVGEELMVRVGKDAYDAAVAQPHARPMDLTGKPMAGFVFVAPPGVDDDADLRDWVHRGLDFTGSLPPKETASGSA